MFVVVDVAIVVIIGWFVLFEEDDWFFVKHFGVRFVSLHFFEKSYVVLNLTFRVHDVVRFSNIRQLVNFTMVVLEPYLVLLGWVYDVWIVGGWSSVLVLFFRFTVATGLAGHLNLKWQVS